MNTRQLQYVIAVAEERSISKAAERLRISQPSLSQYIRNIEKSLEVELFDRNVTPMTPTPIGEEFLKTAYQMLALEGELMKRISDVSEKRVRRLNVGVSAYLNTGEISQTLAEMRKKYPDVNIYIHELFSVVMDEMIEQGELDFSISPIKDSYDNNRFWRDIVSRDRFYIAASHDFIAKWTPELLPATDGDRVSLRKFEKAPFLTMAELSLQTYSLELAAKRAGFTPNITLRCRRWDMLRELVEQNVGVTLLTDRYLIDSELKDDVVLMRLEEEPPDLVGAISYLKGAYLPKAARSFIGSYKRIVSAKRDDECYLKRSYI